MSRPIVAIVGRPNVGKSTLFNRVIGWGKAIVDQQPGLTRDRLYGVAEWRGREFTVVDTAGLDLDGAKDESRAAIEAQTKVAIEEAEAIVLLLDVRAGLTPLDREIVGMLRRSGRLSERSAFRTRDPRAGFRRAEPDLCSAWAGGGRAPGPHRRRAACCRRGTGGRLEGRSARDHGPPQCRAVIPV